MTGEPLGLMCPGCRRGMPWPQAAPLTCPGCGTSYPVREGIPLIRSDDGYYHALLPRDRMQELLARTRSIGWEHALAAIIREEPDHRKAALRDVLLDESRAAFKILFGPLAGRRVLDLGCGSGSTSISLARWAAEVVGCDLTWERVAFLALRAKGLGLPNLRAVCAGDTRPLPFADGSFDCVVLNGVLEWSAGDGGRPVRAAQREFLEEVRRVLRPDGQLYIGIENRLGFYYFLGQPEDHTGVRFAALAPRWLANLMVRRACGHDYRTHTYTRMGYQALLRDAGFRGARFYAPVPDYRRFDEIVPLDSPGACANPPQAGWRGRIKHRLLRNRWLAPSFGIVAASRSPEKPWVSALADHVCRSLNLPTGKGFPGITTTPWSSATMVMRLSHAIVRVPLDPVAEERIRRNFEGLERSRPLAQILPDYESPRPLLADTFHGVPYTVESRLEGRRYHDLPRQEQAAADRRLFEFLLRFTTAPLPGADAAAWPEAWRRLVIDPMARIEACLPQGLAQEELRALRRRVQEPGGDPLPVGFSHGDLWWGNILLDGKPGGIGLFDWDKWSPGHFVTNDFLHFTCYRRVLRDGSTWPQAYTEWLDGRNVDSIEGEWTERFAARLGMRNWRIAAGVAYWVREVTAHDDPKLRLDQLWTASVVDAVLPSLIAAA